MTLCKCGCGKNIISKPHHKYKPVEYLHGHYGSFKYIISPLIYCACGCGKTLKKFNSAHRKRKYIRGHNANGKHNPMYGIGLLGKSNGNWKGGVTSLVKTIRCSNKYQDWRTQVFGRDNFTCQDCGKRGDWLEAHHKKRFSVIIRENNIKTLEEAIMCNELWNIDNGITLCEKCHNETKKMNKMIIINRRE